MTTTVATKTAAEKFNEQITATNGKPLDGSEQAVIDAITDNRSASVFLNFAEDGSFCKVRFVKGRITYTSVGLGAVPHGKG